MYAKWNKNSGGGGGSTTTYYYFAIEKVDAQDGHALNGAKFGLYLDGKQVATATSNRSGIALFRVSASDYRKINAKSELYYQEQGYVVNGGRIGELSQKLYDELTGIQWGKRDDPFGWTYRV